MARMSAPAEGGTALVVDLIDDQLPHLGRQGVERVHLVSDGGGVGEQAVEGDQGDHGREDGQEPEEGDAGAQQGNLIGLGLGPAAFGDLEPALGWYLGRLLGLLTRHTIPVVQRATSS